MPRICRLIPKRRSRGFSLVEAAVVLVVIGIILGAVLQGRSLIESAEYKTFRQELREYRSAFHNFRDRYDGVPGDFPNANARFGGVDPDDGGNGVIDDGPECNNDTDESCIAWQHLRAAGMLGGNPNAGGTDASPEHPFGGVVNGFFTGDQGNGRFGHKILITSLPIDVAIRLDREEDNELCDEGRIALRNSAATDCDGEDWPDSGPVDVVYAL